MPGRKPILKIAGDTSEARRAIRELKDQARDFGTTRETARLEVQADAAEARLNILQQRLERYGRQEQTATVKINAARTLAEIERIEEKLRRLDGKDVHVTVHVREQTRGVTNVLQKPLSGLGGIPLIGGLFGGLSSAVGGIGAIAGVAGQAAGSLASLVPVIGESVAGVVGLGTAALVAAPLLVLLAGAVVALAGVLVELVASLAAAVAGAAVLGAAFAAAMAGPFVIGIAVVAKLVKVFHDLGQEEKNHVAISNRVQAAAQQTTAAQQALADAYANVRQQAQAVRQAQQDAERAVPRDRLAVDQARLGFRDARLALHEFRDEIGAAGPAFDQLFRRFSNVNFRGDPSKIIGLLKGQGVGLDADQQSRLQHLLLDQRSAAFTLSDAIRKLHQDQAKEQDFAKRGIRAYEPYNTALRNVAAAQRQVAAATRAATSAQAAQSGGLDTLNPKERHLADHLRHIKDEFEGAFGPAVDNALGGVVKGLGAIAKAFEAPRVRRALKSLGTELGNQFARFGRFIADPANQKALVQFLNAGKQLVRPLTDLFIAFAKVVRDTARDALPHLISGVKHFASLVTTWEKHHGGAKNFRKTVDGLIGAFKDWGKITEGIGLIIGAFLRAASGGGKAIAGHLGDVLVKWGHWLNTGKGQSALLGFFHRVNTFLKDAIKELEHLIHLWDQVSKRVGSAFTPPHIDTSKGSIFQHPGITPPDIHIVKKVLSALGLQTGGPVGGSGRGDIVPAMLEPGEFVLRRSIVDRIGLPAISALNAGHPGALAMAGGGGGGTTHVYAPITVAGGGPPDPELLSELLGRRLQRLGRGRR